MSILIKGMKMPKNCWECPMVSGYEIAGEVRTICSTVRCRLTNTKRPVEEAISPDCPLVPVPPHGDLIDRDALVKDLKRQCEEVFKIDAVSPDDFWIKRDKAYNERLWKTWCESFFEYLKTRENIIEAEEDE